MTRATKAPLTPEMLDVLYAICTLQPVRPQHLYPVLDIPRDGVREAVAALRSKRLITGTSARGFIVTAEGWAAVSSSDVGRLRDISRLLYLWSRQQGGRG